MSYKKVGGLHHVRIGRLGFSFYWKRRTHRAPQFAEFVIQPLLNLDLERRIARAATFVPDDIQ